MYGLEALYEHQQAQQREQISSPQGPSNHRRHTVYSNKMNALEATGYETSPGPQTTTLEGNVCPHNLDPQLSSKFALSLLLSHGKSERGTLSTYPRPHLREFVYLRSDVIVELGASTHASKPGAQTGCDSCGTPSITTYQNPGCKAQNLHVWRL